MKIIPSVSKNSFTMFMVVVVIMSIFGYYFFIFIPAQEDSIIKENYRILTKTGRNIELRFQDHIKYDSLDNAMIKAIEQNTNDPDLEMYFDHIYTIPDTPLTDLFNADSGIELINKDSLMTIGSGLRTTNIRQVKMAESTYLVFAHKEFIRYTGTDISKKYEGDLYLIGLLDKTEFKRRSRVVGRWFAVNLAIILLILVMLMPLMKLILLSSIERLSRLNVVTLALSLILACGLISLLFVSSYSNFQMRSEIDEELKLLNDSIRLSFEGEINDVYSLLENADTTRWHLADKKGGLTNLFIERSENINRKTRILSPSIVKDRNIKNTDLFWFNENGKARVLYGTSGAGRIDIDVSTRSYFLNLRNEGGWKIPSNSAKNKRFAIQPVVSWTDGGTEAVITKKAEPGLYLKSEQNSDIHLPLYGIGMSTYMSSVMNPILEPGYGFVVIDGAGKVWFESKNQKNLVDNFFDETGQNQEVLSAIQIRSSSFANVNYKNTKIRTRIAPVQNIPLYVITFYEKHLLQSRIIQSVLLNLSLFLFSLILVALLMILLIATSYKSTRLKKKRFYLDWLLPNKDMNSRYNLLWLSNLAIIAFLIGATTLFFYWPNPSQYYYSTDVIFLILVTQLWIFAFTYYLLIFEIPEKDASLAESYTSQSLRSHGKIWVNETSRIFHSKTSWSRGLKFLLCAVAFILIINAAYIFTFKVNLTCLLAFQAVLFFIMWLVTQMIRFYHLHESQKWNTRISRLGKILPNPYPAFALSWILIATFFPVFFFYKYSTAIEARIWTKYKLISIAKAQDERESNISHILKLTDTAYQESLERVKTEGLYFQPRHLLAELPEDYEMAEFEPAPSDPSILYLLKLLEITQEKDVRDFIATSSAHKAWQFVHPKTGNQKESINLKKDLDKVNLVYTSLLSPKRYLVSSKVAPFKRNVMVSILFFVAIAITIIIIYGIIAYAIRKIFATDYRDYVSLKQNSLEFLRDRHFNNRIYLIRMAHASRNDCLAQYLEELDQKGSRYCNIDLGNMDNETYKNAMAERAKEVDVIILNNFDFFSNHHEYYEKKSDFITELERIDHTKKKQFIVSSSHHPLRVIEFYKMMIGKAKAHEWHEKWRDEYESYQHAYSKWKRFFDGYIKLYEPLRKESHQGDSRFSYGDRHIEKLVRSELSYGTYLKNLEPVVYNYCRQLKEKTYSNLEEDIILKIQSMAEPHYYALWASLSRDERFLVFDLAKDGFANVKNTRAIQSLIDKGLIIYENNLNFINQSFNNFVLTVVDEEMEDAMQIELNKKGTWRVFRNIFIIIIISIVAFIAISQPDLMKNVNALITALIAITGLLLRSGVFFGMSGKEA